MMDQFRYTILGCGSSGGVPRLGGHWGDCDPENPRNRRQRCSMLVERSNESGVTRVLIDTSPDLRNQLLTAGIGELDAVVYTHSHADHVHGIDDLRMIVFNMRKRLTVWADGPTQSDLLSRFGYAFVQPDGSPYPPILDLKTIDGAFQIDGAAGPIPFVPLNVAHGSIDALGFRMGPLAYVPDVSDIYPDAWPEIEKAECWVLDALRRAPHPSHSHLEQSLDWIARAKSKTGVLTNMHIDLDYETVKAETPDHILPAFDGMQMTFPAIETPY